MSGSDRGGMQELIQIIKKSKVPIVCICNDRMSQAHTHSHTHAHKHTQAHTHTKAHTHS